MSKDIYASGQEEVIFSTSLFRDLDSFSLVAITFCKALKFSAGYFCIQLAELEQRESKNMDDFVGIFFFQSPDLK